MFVNKDDLSANGFNDVTYGKFICIVIPMNAKPNQIRLTLCGNQINFPDDVEMPTEDMLLVKILFNSIILMEGTKFMTADINNFYLNTLLKLPKYVCLTLSNSTDEIVDEYNLRDRVTPEICLQVEVWKDIYGLPQAGIIVQELSSMQLKPHSYHQSQLEHGLWKHN